MENLNEIEKADQRVGYQVATQMMIFEGNLKWRMTGVFVPFAGLILVAAVMPSFIGINNEKVIAIVATIFSIVGIIISFMWYSMLSRSHKYYEYWIASARELEKQLDTSVKTLERGRRLSAQQEVDGDRFIFNKHERVRVVANLKFFYVLFYY